jgi:hypothetical protein
MHILKDEGSGGTERERERERDGSRWAGRTATLLSMSGCARTKLHTRHWRVFPRYFPIKEVAGVSDCQVMESHRVETEVSIKPGSLVLTITCSGSHYHSRKVKFPLICLLVSLVSLSDPWGLHLFFAIKFARDSRRLRTGSGSPRPHPWFPTAHRTALFLLPLHCMFASVGNKEDSGNAVLRHSTGFGLSEVLQRTKAWVYPVPNTSCSKEKPNPPSLSCLANIPGPGAVTQPFCQKPQWLRLPAAR